MAEANLYEIYQSIDGEGMHAGRPVVVVRFAGCNLSCSYCDTPEARKPCDTADVLGHSGATTIENPIDIDEVISIVTGRFPDSRNVLLTGGEPFVQSEAAVRLGLGLRLKGFGIHLETNGTLTPESKLARIAFDFVSMDIKLPSSQGGRRLWQEHASFIAFFKGVQMAAKIVFDSKQLAEVKQALELIGQINPHLPVFLQPVYHGDSPAMDSEVLVEITRQAQAMVTDVRVSLQMHKILGLR